MEKEPITFQGLEKLKKELEELKNIKRPKIVEAIAEARGHGDLKENAEYHAAKEEQSKVESRINEINDLIARANIIDVTKLEKKDNVIFGSTVHLIDLEINIKKTYKIVGKDEADITKNYIYFRSPIGKSLIGRKKKETITVTTPAGEKNFEILEVEYI
ncbi:MAG: transcription elongation factor GreA [Pelagibacteraceae bacterium]|jgi:transcription elongation factor GreA|nr:transcription elongation factor GreA [Pelagibacteraceae bacterium]MDP6710210.1 transcription elongation factor GreA [Pelagibacteraceae bacterium]|tara:strand:- start:1108 stop:1584 length:477 start_codon:yes stop_codon:yes gene_type:complete